MGFILKCHPCKEKYPKLLYIVLYFDIHRICVPCKIVLREVHKPLHVNPYFGT